MRTLIVEGDEEFRVEIPDDARITFGPWSPPNKDGRHMYGDDAKRGTLRVYKNSSSDSVIFVRSGVTGFRDTAAVNFKKKVAQQVGATLWETDEGGYEKTEVVQNTTRWVDPDDAPKALPPARTKGKRGPGRPPKKRGPGRPRKTEVMEA